MGYLIAGGDSFIYGSELTDCVDESGVEQASKLTFPSLIAKECGLEYVCTAMPGYSNTAIRRNVMDACETHTNIDLVLVQWTFSSRFEFRFGNSYADWKQIGSWLTIDDPKDHIDKTFLNANDIVRDRHIKFLEYQKLLGVSDFAKIFYKHIKLNYWEKYTTLSEMVMLQQYLTIRKIPYLFTVADSEFYDIFHKTFDFEDQTIKTLKNQIDEKYIMYYPSNLGFLQWAMVNKFPFGTTHPMDEAHIEAANIVYEHLRYIGRLP